MSNLLQRTGTFNELCADPVFRHQVTLLWEQGPRPVGEFIACILRRCPAIIPEIKEALAIHAYADAEYLRRHGFERWQPQIVIVPADIMKPSISSGVADKAAILVNSLRPRGDA